MSALKEKLDTVERGEWRKQKAIIAKGREDFWTFMKAIKVVRDKRLYREDYKTFEAFVESECGIVKSYVNRLIEASNVRDDLAPMGAKNPKACEINKERQLRELVDVPKDELEAVVEKAAEIAGDAPITAKIIREAKAEVLEYEDVPDREPGADDETPEETELLALPPAEQALKAAAIHREIHRVISQAIQLLDKVEESPGTELLVSRRVIISRELTNARNGVNATRPHAICERCRGAGCVQCGNHGWVTSAVAKGLAS